MEHSKKYSIVASHYNDGTWTIDQVHAAVPRWITAEEYKEITGEEYE